MVIHRLKNKFNIKKKKVYDEFKEETLRHFADLIIIYRNEKDVLKKIAKLDWRKVQMKVPDKIIKNLNGPFDKLNMKKDFLGANNLSENWKSFNNIFLAKEHPLKNVSWEKVLEELDKISEKFKNISSIN